MGLLYRLFSKPPYPSTARGEVEQLLRELLQIGKTEGFLSERPGGAFNAQCRHNRTREIGKRLHEIGQFPLMEYAYHHARRKLGKELSTHLEYAWSDIGRWLP